MKTEKEINDKIQVVDADIKKELDEGKKLRASKYAYIIALKWALS